jgi:hypothetical protein
VLNDGDTVFNIELIMCTSCLLASMFNNNIEHALSIPGNIVHIPAITQSPVALCLAAAVAVPRHGALGSNLQPPHPVLFGDVNRNTSQSYEGPHWTKINPSSNITRIQADHRRFLKIFAVSQRLAVYGSVEDIQFRARRST